MELTNLIWHLGALVAALWAGFSYRALLLRQQELESGVLASLLDIKAEFPGREDYRASSRQLALVRSARIRALVWFGEEFLRRHHLVLSIKDKDTLLLLSAEQWRAAVAELYGLLLRPRGLPVAGRQAYTLQWEQSSAPKGLWIVVSEQGVRDVV